ncbi:hypothetical protein QN386_17905 [Pseudomonas sp. CCI3.2]|uniref:hypothetical protein n=1 Tax=unclassified Pseudomonas TaxID=196821 RepID=UPI002B230135|nr:MULTISPECIES: hypothetical protein [unclassified Pseudomonas]MEB0078068.1 hypothetical protein [Pseudomonas sp. MH10out]MEB0103184.1 hypothetical protein [Pseudomonas sp. CCI3.2]MEB0133601.1 hypothetical protein [Pseudomonas sp. CCI2.4]MEB0170070.1 hypothetical protein [Pseudomonas sp. CCC4.4]
MTDRELLELAAKAAGHLNAKWCAPSNDDACMFVPYPEGERNGCHGFEWNPLDRDGDALRLAANLKLDVIWFNNLQYVTVERQGFGENIGWDDDAGRSGALRQAITVVAAQIGKTL